MFSWEYVRRAAASVARNPSAFVGGDAGARIYERRMHEWSRVRQEYRDKPKKTLGFKIFLDPEDMSQISGLIATSGYPNLPVTCLLSAILRRGMKTVDVGANLGFYSFVAARAVGSEGRVWAFEPEPHNFTLLSRSIKANGFENVEPVKMALSTGAKNERLYLAPPSEPNAHTLTQDRGMGSLEISSTSLDEFWKSEMGKLDLLKVHVFGDEPLVLRGSMQVIERDRPHVITRFGPKWNEDPGLLDALYAWYHVYEIVDSPSLVRPIEKSSLTAEARKGIYLKPKI